jgi:hypothetical protein
LSSEQVYSIADFLISVLKSPIILYLVIRIRPYL